MDVCRICSKEIANKDIGVNVSKEGLTSLLGASMAKHDQKPEEIFR